MQVLAPFESQGERRRAQLLAVTAHLVVTEGVDAVTHAAVAEVAGCARTLAYRYFPTREDLLFAIPLEYATAHARRVSDEDAAAGVLALSRARRGQIPAAALHLSERMWNLDEWTPRALELRMAMLVILGDRDLAAALTRQGTHPHLVETQLEEPLRTLGFGPREIAVVHDTILAGYYHVTAAALAGEITREDAVKFSYRVNRAAVQMFLT
jgi:AcrR family transcriptional regulator